MRRRATAIEWRRSGWSMTRIANSSPPSRAARSPSRIVRPDPLGDGDQELVAGGMAERVVDDLEVVEVEEQDDRHPVGLPVAEVLRDLLGEQGPVRQVGQRVVVGLVAELLLEPAELGQRLLELAVLERDRDLVGERLEEAQVVVAEARALGQPVDDRQGPDHARTRRRAGRSSPGGSSCCRPPGVRPGMAKNARRSVDCTGPDRVGLGQLDRDHELGLAVLDRRGRPEALATAPRPTRGGPRRARPGTCRGRGRAARPGHGRARASAGGSGWTGRAARAARASRARRRRPGRPRTA